MRRLPHPLPDRPGGETAVREAHRQQAHFGGIPDGEDGPEQSGGQSITGRQVLYGLVILAGLTVLARSCDFPS
ncbi:hypothetical protein SHKM778_94080 (plasmid) [Streptomyces sp. KM77-8]|uniref:Uncharacterized protein n=1 Tax=Streptomyces haneummycinicus TaxID=3074435 RepID=A0AAT9HZE2_9ACTN